MAQAGPTPDSATQMEASASLLEDASTLLMFHNTAVTSHGTEQEPDHNKQQELQQQQRQSQPQPQPQHQHQHQHQHQPNLLSNVTVTKSSSPKSPSPTSASTTTSKLTSFPSGSKPRVIVPSLPHAMSGISSPGPAIAALADSDSDGSDKERGQNQKGIVAAAALAAAAGIPLPLIRSSRVDNTTVDERLRGIANINHLQIQSDHLQNAQTEVAKEQMRAFHENTAIMRHNKDFTAKPIEDDARSDATTAEMNRDNDDDQEGIKPKNETSDEKDTVGEEDTQDEKSETSTSQVRSRTKKPKTNPILNDYIVDPNAGTITCICAYGHDDGFTIQCDHCNRWQHALCMGIDSMDEVPEKFQCNVCQPRKLDVKKAKALQQKRRKERKDQNGEALEADVADDAANDTNGDKELKPLQAKPKPKPPTNAYGKNLEESDIQIPEGKESSNVSYYKLGEYDYQNTSVYRFVQENIKESTESSFIRLSRDELEAKQLAKFDVRSYSEVNNKKFNGIMKLGLFAEENIEPSTFIQEYLGEIGFKQDYIVDSRNQYRIWGVEKPYVSFVPNTSLVIDARLSGNSTRYIRRSCHPNCEIRVVNVDNNEIKFYVVALKPIKTGTELTLQWNWDSRHPIRNIIEGNTFDSTADSDKPCLVLSIESVLTFVECACTQTNECSLSKVKKASAHIYRSTRKGNSTSGLKLMQKEAVYVSIQERLLVRNNASILDTEERVKNLIPLLQTSNTTAETEISTRPYIYTYMRKRPHLELDDKHDGNLAIPIEILAEEDIVKSIVETPPKPVKKLSFADYKRMKKPA